MGPGLRREAAAVLSLEFARGTLGSVLVSTRAEQRTPLEIVAEARVLRAEDAFSVERPIEIEFLRGGSVTQKEVVSNADAYARQVDMFSTAIEDNLEGPVPGEEGWQNQEVLDAAYRSLKSGKAETVPLVEKKRQDTVEKDTLIQSYRAQLSFAMNKLSTFRAGANPNCALLAKVAVLVFIGALQSSCTGKPSAPTQASTERPAKTGKQSGTAPGIVRHDPPPCPPWSSAEPRPSQAKGGHRVILSWRASAPADSRHAAAIGYCIYRGLEPDDPSPVRVNTVPYPGTNCADDLVQNDKKYSYVVRAISAGGIRSESSNRAFAEIPNREPSNPSGSSVPLCREPVSRKQF